MSKAGEKAPEIRLSIEEVSDLTGLKQHVLRYWEAEFPPLRPERTRANQRLYRQKDVDLILHIKQLLYERKFTLQGAREQLENDLKDARQQGQLALELDLEQSQLMGTLVKARRQARSILDLLDKEPPPFEPEA
jgi:DNA-binding transcriptional MerR regulator